jgi:hypothetical protein
MGHGAYCRGQSAWGKEKQKLGKWGVEKLKAEGSNVIKRFCL